MACRNCVQAGLFGSAMSLAAVHARLFSSDLLNAVPFLLDGECLELRHCPVNTISRAACEHVHHSRWLRFTRATIELFGPPRTCERAIAIACEAFNLDQSQSSRPRCQFDTIFRGGISMPFGSSAAWRIARERPIHDVAPWQELFSTHCNRHSVP